MSEGKGAHGDGRGDEGVQWGVGWGGGGGDWTKIIWEVKEDGKRGGMKRLGGGGYQGWSLERREILRVVEGRRKGR
jgi:hypothetical protein